MSKIWFSSDLHLNHFNIIKYTNRPFKSVEDMNETIIANHNAVVAPDDKWFHLGDFAMAGSGKASYFLSRLNGIKYMIAGNHDKRVLFKRDADFNIQIKDGVKNQVQWVKDYYEMWVDKQFVVLHHYAPRVWNASHKGGFYLYGHSHGSLPDDPNALSMDVGIDAIAMYKAVNGVKNPKDYRPISWDEVKEFMAKKNVC